MFECSWGNAVRRAAAADKRAGCIPVESLRDVQMQLGKCSEQSCSCRKAPGSIPVQSLRKAETSHVQLENLAGRNAAGRSTLRNDALATSQPSAPGMHTLLD